MLSKPLKSLDWCRICQKEGHHFAYCDFLSDGERLAVALSVRKERKKKVKKSTSARGGDTEEPDQFPLISPAHIRSGVVSLYSDSPHRTLNIYDSPILAVSHDSKLFISSLTREPPHLW